MSSDTEQQQVDIALMEEENEGLSSKKVQPKSKTRSPRNYLTAKYIVGYGVPILIVILAILGFILAFIAIRKYNRNCKHAKEGSCRGIKWFFT
jgi:uncharacterized membrane protein